MSNNYPIVSGLFFGVIAVLHAVRAVYQWPVNVGTMEIPVWVSWIALVISGGLCVWAFRSRGR